MQTTQLTKVVIIAETNNERQILRYLLEIGVKAFTCVACIGRDQASVYDQPFLRHTQTRIEAITSRHLAEAVLHYTNSPEFRNSPVTSFLESVEVLDEKQFVSPPEQAAV